VVWRLPSTSHFDGHWTAGKCPIEQVDGNGFAKPPRPPGAGTRCRQLQPLPHVFVLTPALLAAWVAEMSMAMAEVIERGQVSAARLASAALTRTQFPNQFTLNVTYQSSLRADAHPRCSTCSGSVGCVHLFLGGSAYPGRVKDCLHWCLPGVPDSWNELLLAMARERQWCA
jgi:hypothetical protein